MKNIITAIGNPEINNQLIKLNKYNILAPDIQYQDGINEIIFEREDIDILILSDLIDGNTELIEFVFNIKKINNKLEIIIILEKEDEEIKNKLIAKGIFNIFYNNKITLEEIINLIDNQKTNIEKEITKEINNLKKIILENNSNNNLKTEKEKKNINLIKRIINKLLKTNKSKTKIKKRSKMDIKNNIICMTGTLGSGKTTAALLLSYYLSKLNNKILIIDSNNFKKDINIILAIKKYSKRTNGKIKNNEQKNIINKDKINLDKYIIKINKNINLIYNLNNLLNSNNNFNSIKNIFNNIKELKQYDFIIIDTQNNNEDNKYIIKNSDICIHMLEGNLLSLKESREMLYNQLNNLNIPQEKIHIIFNKINKHSIKNKSLNNIYSDFNILGKIKYRDKYDLIINKNKINIKDKKIKKEYQEIINNLLNINRIKNQKRKIKNKILNKFKRRKFYGSKYIRTSY